MQIVRGLIYFLLLTAGVCFALYAATGDQRYKRWGLIKEHPDYLGVAKQINQIDIYKQAATASQTPVQAWLFPCAVTSSITCCKSRMLIRMVTLKVLA